MAAALPLIVRRFHPHPGRSSRAFAVSTLARLLELTTSSSRRPTVKLLGLITKGTARYLLKCMRGGLHSRIGNKADYLFERASAGFVARFSFTLVIENG